MPLLRGLIRIVGVGDPWDRFPRRFPVRVFGTGSKREFRWYFEGHSSVDAQSLDDVCDWLLDCEYVSDPDLFHEPDFWQHPRTFERLKKGDCEDHALWAWRKLVELGFQAELMSGSWTQAPGEFGGHVWVRFRQENRDFVLEAVANSRERMVRPLEEVREEYEPHVGVDNEFNSYGYFGYLRELERR
ncbi:MAG TPA: hypothetical protein VFT29_18875 [Gemmatimonadaceae bacterium]|nr:hypothetical protein [Gemmatimonadaceae bacterium]